MGTPADVPITPGSGAEVATWQITESSTTKQIQRIALSDSAGNDLAGSETDAAASNTDGTPISWTSIFKQHSLSLQQSATSLASLVTGQVLAAGSALIGIVKIGDGTNSAAIKAASTAAAQTDAALATRNADIGTVSDTAYAGSGSSTVSATLRGLYALIAAGISAAVTQSGTWSMRLLDGSGNSIGSTSGALNVNIAGGGGSGGTALADEGTYTQGTTSFTPVGGEYNSSIASLTSGKAGAVAMTANRAMSVALSDGSGNALASSSGALNVNITGGAGSGGTSLADESTFTEGTTGFTPVGGTYNSSSTNLTSGKSGAAGMTAFRALFTTLFDNAQNQITIKAASTAAAQTDTGLVTRSPDIGTTSDTAYTGSGNSTVNATLRGIYAVLTTLYTAVTGAIPAVIASAWNANTYTGGTTQSVSADLHGNLWTDVGAVGGSALALGRTTPAASLPMVAASQTYSPVAASQTAAKFGATGATGDYLDGVLIVPATTSPGAVSITDGSGSAISIFAGGSSSIGSLQPFYVPIGAVSKNGAGGWQVTTGANVSVIGVGNFT